MWRLAQSQSPSLPQEAQEGVQKVPQRLGCRTRGGYQRTGGELAEGAMASPVPSARRQNRHLPLLTLAEGFAQEKRGLLREESDKGPACS